MAGDQDYMGTAFPQMPPCDASGQSVSGYPYPENGLTKREYMATAILPAVIAATSAGQHHPDLDGMSVVAAMARDAVAMADALLLELGKT